MKTLKFMHIADYHIGYEYPFLGSLSALRKGQVLESLEYLLRYAYSNQINLILIAGDFLEASSIGPSVANQVKNLLSKYPVKTFIVAGNHDYISLGSYYLDSDWPENVHIFKNSNIEEVYLEEFDTSIFAASFKASYQRDGFLKHFPQINKDRINIGLIHGDALFQADDLYNPIRKEEIEKSGLDYLALGHIHKKSGILKSGFTDYAYPGSPMGIGFFEAGSRQVIIGKISKEERSYQFLDLPFAEFVEEWIDITDLETEEKIALKIKNILNEKYDDYEKNYYRISLNGLLSHGLRFDIDLLKSMLGNLNYLELIDDTILVKDVETLAKEQSLRGAFIREAINDQELAKKMGDLDQYLLLERAIKLTLKAFEGNQL